MTKKKSWVCLVCGKNRKFLLYSEKRLSGKTIVPSEAVCTGETGIRGCYGNIWKCRSCGLIFQEPTFTDDELENAYGGGEDARYFEQLSQRVSLFEKILRKMEEFTSPPGRLLDIGCNAGIFLDVAQRSGWKVEGIELSKWAAWEAKKRYGVRVKVSDFESVKYKSKYFDVITMWDVLEHYIDPVVALKKARKLLKDDGVIALSTINIDSWFSKILGRHWTWLIRIHLWYFTRDTLTKMMEKSGYEVEWMGEQVRWFSLPYLLTRFTGWNFTWLPSVSLPAPTGDIIWLIARKAK
jgi:2-polyprenyl-3-methyl-5-hydroxy-6-metoxy-1,4-benzoquinol methylase